MRLNAQRRRKFLEAASKHRAAGPPILPDIAIKGRGRVAQMRIPQDELEAQAERLSAYAARDLTGRIFNDPPVGMSALDEREESA